MFVDLNRLARQRCRKWMPKHRKVNYGINTNAKSLRILAGNTLSNFKPHVLVSHISHFLSF
jgi:hypothetical protein